MHKSVQRWQRSRCERSAVIAATFLLTLAFPARRASAQYASAVLNYNAGTGAVASYNQPASALGEPSRFTNDPDYPGPVDPYDPPYLNSQVVSLGTGGSLTLQMSTPIRNDSANPFGLDFIVYGNAGFIEDFNTGKTAGALFGAATPGSTRVSVSADNVQYFTIDMSLAPAVDSYFPTDGAGTFGLAVNPALANAASFNGATLADIRARYAGSAGGAGFDLAWARNGNGDPVSLDSVNYVKIEVLSGAAEIDGIAAVPEPSTYALAALGASVLLFRKRRS